METKTIEQKPTKEEKLSDPGNLDPKTPSKHATCEDQSRMRELWSKAEIPTRHSQTKNLTGEAWSDTFKKVASRIGKGFIVALIGDRGTGKSQLAVEVARQSVRELRTARYVTAMRFFLLIKATYKRDSLDTEIGVIDDFARPKCLIIDECQERGETQWEDQLLGHLIDKRYALMKDTILVSNLKRQDFLKSLGPSIISRLNETGGIVECSWRSYR